MATASGSAQERTSGLGTFAGVFTPSILTILGIILFLRLGYVIGNAGLTHALLILALANVISVLTSISVAAIATNLKVKGGGDYYLISRTLGVEYGGAIGLVMFLAQSVSVGFYCMGFAEVVSAMSGGNGIGSFATGTAAVLGLFVLTWLGANIANRFQYIVMVLTIATLASFAIGAMRQWDPALLASSWSEPDSGLSFWILFAVFFPAVTGFTQGVSMSGDLRDAARSIPLGTFAAVGVSFVVYLGAVLLFAGALPLADLRADTGAMRTVSLSGWLFDAGVIASTLSSALASFMGAPRILQALAKDKVIRRLDVFAAGHGANDAPRRATLASLAIALLVVSVGSLNAVAAIVSMFFLISYGLLNYATFFEARAQSPSFRPTFRFFDHRASLAGAAICAGSMVAIDLDTALIAAAVMFGLFQFLKSRKVAGRWADSRRSHHLKQARDHLLAAAEEEAHGRDWRPQVLAFSDQQERRGGLLRFARRIEGGSGITTVIRLVRGQGVELVRRRNEMTQALGKSLAELDAEALPLVVGGADPAEMLPTIIQSMGAGPLGVNTVLVNHLETRSPFLRALSSRRFGENLRMALSFGCNIVVLRASDEAWRTFEDSAPEKRRIDIWWTEGPTGLLTLLLAYLTTRDRDLNGARIRLIPVRSARSDRADQAADALAELLDEARISADVHLLDSTADTPDLRELVEASRDAALVFVPLALDQGRMTVLGAQEIDPLLEDIPIAAMCLAAGSIDLVADPDSGAAAQRGAALDRLTAAERNLAELSKLEDKAHEAVREAEQALIELSRTGGSDEDVQAAAAAVQRLRVGATESARRTTRGTIAYEAARADAEALGAIDPETEEAAGND